MMKGIKWLLIVSIFLFLTMSCKEDEENANDSVGPSVPSKTITITDLAANSLVLNWEKATDDNDSQSELKYSVYQSDSNNLSTLAEINDNGTALVSSAADISTLNVSGLKSPKPYTFNIVVSDSEGNRDVYTAVSITTPFSQYSKSFLLAEMSGSYVDNYLGPHHISSTHWINGKSSYILSKIDTSNDFLIGENSADHPYNPGKFSRFDWTVDASGDLYYCQSAYDKDSAGEAEAVTTANNSTPAINGCGDLGFPWSKLIPFDDVSGDYVDFYKSPHSVTAAHWVNGQSKYLVVKIDSSNDFLIAQNEADHPYNPGKFSRFDWTVDATGDAYYCQSAYDKDTAAGAEAENTANRTTPSQDGCGSFDFPWTKLLPFTELKGAYVDNYKGPHQISADNWINGQNLFNIQKIDTSNDYLIAKNGDANPYNSGKYSRMDWTVDATGDLYYCQVAYDKDTADQAESVSAPDPSSPSLNGCGDFDFPWSKLIGFNELKGNYTDNYLGTHSISPSLWINGDYTFHAVQVDVSNDYLISQNASDNAYFPGLYSRFDWTVDASGDTYYCQTAYNASSIADAAATSSPDATSPAINGCGQLSFPWSKLYSFEGLK